MKRQARDSIVEIEKRLLEWNPSNYVEDGSAVRDLAKALEGLAKYWEKNPTRWTQGSYYYSPDVRDVFGQFPEGDEAEGVDMNRLTMCNMGLLWTAKNDYPTIGFKLDRRAVSAAEAFEGFIVELNDAAHNLEANIEGLRLTAKALRLHAKNGNWAKSVKWAFAENRRLNQVQNARYVAKTRAAFGLNY